MSMTSAADQYFSRVAPQWDSIRSGYFTESVRALAIQKAYLRPEMVVADVGAGTGFMAAGLAPLVKQVFVFDGSSAMLAEARENLKDFENVVFQQVDGLSLPLPDASLDAVFANMYLHHCTDPLAAIREMARLLRPGGRLVLTDMDAHTHEWMKAEMADVWLGFERHQVRRWFHEAGLVNVIVDCSGESCCATSEKECEADSQDDLAQVSIFVGVGTCRMSGAQQAVQAHYQGIAVQAGGCCSPAGSNSVDCCGPDGLISLDEALIVDELSFKEYTADDRITAPAEAAAFSLGCGNPGALAGLQLGETVLDIGSGGGLDSFLAAHKVGPTGRVIGVDMTPEMLERARRSAAQAGIQNVEFRRGQAEALPVEDSSVDVILSNCVINLTEDKGIVFEEAYRALRPGGRLEVSDMVTDGSIPAELRADPQNWGGCVFGALPEREYLDLIAQAGFKEVKVHRRASMGEGQGVKVASITVSAYKTG